MAAWATGNTLVEIPGERAPVEINKSQGEQWICIRRMQKGPIAARIVRRALAGAASPSIEAAVEAALK